MLKKLVVKKSIDLLTTTQKKRMTEKRKKKLRKLKKQKEKEHMISMFGKTRYYLSYWFGGWVLFAWNNRPIYTGKPYQKFYTDESVATRYANKLQNQYEKITIDKVFDKHRKQIGYMLYGKGKKAAASTQQPSNVIPFEKYKLAKAK